MAADEPVLDLDVARKLLPGDDSFVRRVAALTREEMPAQLRGARTALEDGDLEGCRKGVHSFQTAIRSFGAVAACRASDVAMQTAAAGDLDATRAAMAPLEAAIATFLDALGEIDAYLEAEDGGRAAPLG